MKRIFGISATVSIIATITFFALAIWTHDERWLHTAFLGVATSFGLSAAATYPGWDD